MALIGAILVEIKIIEILCKRLLGKGDRQALEPSKHKLHDISKRNEKYYIETPYW